MPLAITITIGFSEVPYTLSLDPLVYNLLLQDIPTPAVSFNVSLDPLAFSLSLQAVSFPPNNYSVTLDPLNFATSLKDTTLTAPGGVKRYKFNPTDAAMSIESQHNTPATQRTSDIDVLSTHKVPG